MKSLGLYIHIPFCKTICVYCNFPTFANKNKWIPEYLLTLRQEIQLKSKLFSNYQIQTIYFGGGTPSLLEADQISTLLKEIRQHFQTQNLQEISIECNPESLNLEKIRVYQQLGISRISLGVQSLNPKTLWKVARPHDEKQALAALQLLKNNSWENFSCDLIMGLPYQSKNEFIEHLETLLAFDPKHLSAYFLSYDTKRIDTFIQESPKEEEQIEMYWELNKILGKKGFQHYEVSNYAKPGFESQHNLRYWNQQEYLGLGLGAHSYINQTVSENTKNFQTYLSDPLEKEDQYILETDVQRMDFIMLSLRQSKGLNLSEYQKRYGRKALNELIQKSSLYQKELSIDSNRIRPNNQGFLIIDRITRDLI